MPQALSLQLQAKAARLVQVVQVATAAAQALPEVMAAQELMAAKEASPMPAD